MKSKTIHCTVEIIIQGLVQGIGYRPFVADLAAKMGLTGSVRNTDGVVTIVVCGNSDDIEIFKEKLLSEAPALAKITEISCREMDIALTEGFVIEESDILRSHNIPHIPTDIATCKSCERELFDEADRRYRHPFISCTDCGPRYSILENLPYDRPRITMKKFPLCPECEREYTLSREIIPGNRRRHAQTIACPECGPRLALWEDGKEYFAGDDRILNRTITSIKSGGILAIMDIGGFHLACLANDEKAVEKLRTIKRRTRKPFAIMFADIDEVARYAEIDEKEKELLENNARPIVLLKRRWRGERQDIAPSAGVNSPYIGAMLPSCPLQMILVRECGPLVMTSANISGGLIMTDPDEMRNFANQTKNRIEILYHDRPILTPLDDSVVQVVSGRTQIIRRARGYVPEPVPLPQLAGMPAVFAAGGDMKAAFAYFEDGKAVLSQPFGDMETEEIQDAWCSEKERMKRLFGFAPEKVACDAHPGYYTRAMTEGAEEAENAGNIASIYHHHSHAAAVIAEHDIKGDVICLAFDGTGYGEDGTIWGSEFFHWDGTKMHRFASLKPVKLQGSAEGVRNADTVLAGYLEKEGAVRKAIDAGINTVTSSSMGRLFDAVSALLNICHYSEYEGEAAIELEYAAAKAAKATKLNLPIIYKTNMAGILGDSESILEQIKTAQEVGTDRNELALGFIYAVAEWALSVIELHNASLLAPVCQVALSGGTFQNRILLERVIYLLENSGYMVYTNEQVPPGDGGLALGQIFMEAYRD